MSRQITLRAGLLPFTLLAAVACGEDKTESDTVGPSTGGPATVTVGTSGSGGGDGGSGGAPGSGGGGAGPGGGGASSSGGGSSVGSTGSGIPDECGEPGDCAGDQPTACGSNACQAPEIFFICGNDEEPPAYNACFRAENVYRTGVWARFIDCLREGDEETQCNDGEALVDACLASTLAETCPNVAADNFCDTTAEKCDDEGQPFDIAACKADLITFGENGFALYGACLDDPGVPGLCNLTHQECFEGLIPSP